MKEEPTPILVRANTTSGSYSPLSLSPEYEQSPPAPPGGRPWPHDIARKSAEHWTDIYLIVDPDNAIREQVENAALHEATISIIVK
ncbi:MAG: hypothetical protein HPY46_08395 [Candidatus Aminicenantes bacterium]|nr:hypothetical protein [Candidatus Aminicenantes bacterium]